MPLPNLMDGNLEPKPDPDPLPSRMAGREGRPDPRLDPIPDPPVNPENPILPFDPMRIPIECTMAAYGCQIRRMNKRLTLVMMSGA